MKPELLRAMAKMALRDWYQRITIEEADAIRETFQVGFENIINENGKLSVEVGRLKRKLLETRIAKR